MPEPLPTTTLAFVFRTPISAFEKLRQLGVAAKTVQIVRRAANNDAGVCFRSPFSAFEKLRQLGVAAKTVQIVRRAANNDAGVCFSKAQFEARATSYTKTSQV